MADLFELGRTPARYDLIAEHTCFCAIDPLRRDEYVDQVAAALVPGGALVGLFYAHGRPGGPPFTVDADELRARFGRRFVVDSLGNIMLTMLNPLVITRTDDGEFLFHSLQYSARGGDSDEYYFLAHHGATVVFSGAGVNANDPGNFKTDVSQPGLTELSGFATQPITRLTVVSSKTTPTQADYSHVAMDNLQFTVVSEVPEPATFALFGIGLLALSARRARR